MTIHISRGERLKWVIRETECALGSREPTPKASTTTPTTEAPVTTSQTMVQPTAAPAGAKPTFSSEPPMASSISAISRGSTMPR